MRPFVCIFQREFLGYFRSPVAYVVLVVFLLSTMGLAFFVGRFFSTGVASLESFFSFHPWVYLLFAPAVAMRLWAEEKRGGTAELLFTLPMTPVQAVLGKFLASWTFTLVALALTFPLPLTVAWLGDPDWGVVLSSYLGSALMVAAYLAVCSLASALTRNQVVAFVLGVFACGILLFLGWSVFAHVLGQALPVSVVDAISNFSFATHYQSMTRGLVDVRSLAYFAVVTVCSLAAGVVVLER